MVCRQLSREQTASLETAPSYVAVDCLPQMLTSLRSCHTRTLFQPFDHESSGLNNSSNTETICRLQKSPFFHLCRGRRPAVRFLAGGMAMKMAAPLGLVIECRVGWQVDLVLRGL